MVDPNYKPDGGYIETANGRLFYLEHPEFYIDDIAHALGMKVRYGGHCSSFYSVAEHSLLVSHLCEHLELADPLEGLMHDAHEAYIGDMPSPIKHVLPDFKAMEHKLESSMREYYKLPPETTPGCKRADLIALYIEAAELLPSGGKHLFPNDPHDLMTFAQELEIEPMCLAPEDAARAFVVRFQRLINR